MAASCGEFERHACFAKTTARAVARCRHCSAARRRAAYADAIGHVRSSVSCASVPRVLGRSTVRVLRALRPRWREVTGLRARAACPGTDALPRRQPSLNRRPPLTSIPSSPSGAESCRRASFRTRSSSATGRSRVRNPAVGGHVPAKPTEVGTRAVSHVATGGPHPAAEGGPRLSPKAVAVAARTARGCRATSSAHGAARTGTSSARRSAWTPSTPQPSTSSRPSPRPRTVRATSTWALRSGTAAQGLSPRQPIGRRCRIRNRGRPRNGAGRR